MCAACSTSPTPANGASAAPGPLVREALNDFGEASYDGPCPPQGAARTYQLTVYALHDAVPASYGKDTPPARAQPPAVAVARADEHVGSLGCADDLVLVALGGDA